jgi:hypothetical protein
MTIYRDSHTAVPIRAPAAPPSADTIIPLQAVITSPNIASYIALGLLVLVVLYASYQIFVRTRPKPKH